MDPNLYASPSEISMRMPPERNVWLATVSVSIPVILGRYMLYGEKFELRDERERSGDSDAETIDKFLNYLHKQGKMWVGKTNEINKTITLLSKDKDVSKVEHIINDLTNVLNNVRNKKIKGSFKKLEKELGPYFNLFNALSESVKKEPRPDCHGFCTCERDCDD